MQPSYVPPGSTLYRGCRPAIPMDNGTSQRARKGGDAGPGGPTTMCDGVLPSGRGPTEKRGPDVPPTAYR